MPGIKWAQERELTQTLGGEADGGGRMTGAYGTEASLQLDDSLFRRSDHNDPRNNMLGTESHFQSSDLAIFDGFGDDPQEEDEEEQATEDKQGDKAKKEKRKGSELTDKSDATVDKVSAAMAETKVSPGGKKVDSV